MSECKQCPHDVGDSYQRDCEFPDCMGGWEEAELDDRIPAGITECESYGMTWGCDEDCPVLIAGDCELKDADNKELYALAAKNNT